MAKGRRSHMRVYVCLEQGHEIRLHLSKASMADTAEPAGYKKVGNGPCSCDGSNLMDRQPFDSRRLADAQALCDKTVGCIAFDTGTAEPSIEPLRPEIGPAIGSVSHQQLCGLCLCACHSSGSMSLIRLEQSIGQRYT